MSSGIEYPYHHHDRMPTVGPLNPMNEPDTTVTPDTITRADDVYPLTLGGPNYPITLEPSSFALFGDARCVMTITPEGRLVPGEGLSPDEATQAMFKTLTELWEGNNAYVEGLKADKERLDWLDLQGMGSNPKAWSVWAYTTTVRDGIDANREEGL